MLDWVFGVTVLAYLDVGRSKVHETVRGSNEFVRLPAALWVVASHKRVRNEQRRLVTPVDWRRREIGLVGKRLPVECALVSHIVFLFLGFARQVFDDCCFLIFWTKQLPLAPSG